MKEMTDEQQQMVNLYKKMGIGMQEVEDGRILVRQSSVTNGILLNQYDLRQRGKQVFPDRHIIPQVFFLDTSIVTPEWIQEKMKGTGLYQRDLSKQLGMNETMISKLINGKRPMSSAVQALFYYYFTLYEVTKEFRQDDE